MKLRHRFIDVLFRRGQLAGRVLVLRLRVINLLLCDQLWMLLGDAFETRGRDVRLVIACLRAVNLLASRLKSHLILFQVILNFRNIQARDDLAFFDAIADID